MKKTLSENLESYLPTSVGVQIHLSHWHPISTAPCNQEAELRISEEGAILTLEFPCLQTNAGEWIDVDLGTRIDIKPVEWRIWRHSKSPQPHHSKIRPNDRSALLHHDNRCTEQSTSIEFNDILIQKADAAT